MLVSIIELIVSFIISYFLTPKPKSPKPASMADFSVPTAEDGRPVVDVAGTVWLDAPNVIWYGDLYNEPVRADGGK